MCRERERKRGRYRPCDVQGVQLLLAIGQPHALARPAPPEVEPPLFLFFLLLFFYRIFFFLLVVFL